MQPPYGHGGPPGGYPPQGHPYGTPHGGSGYGSGGPLPPYGHGYGGPPQNKGPNVLLIVILVLGVLMVLGGASCLVCVGFGALGAATDTTPASNEAPLVAEELERNALARQLETAMTARKVPVKEILCPKDVSASNVDCRLETPSGDRATVKVTRGATGLAFDTPGVAFLEGPRLAATFSGIVGARGARLTVPCFSGTLMKPVGQDFTCPVMNGSANAGTVTVSVLDGQGGVKMSVDATAGGEPVRPAPVPTGKARPRTVDFVCPPGQKPGGAVRAGCLCGDTILGTACGAPGSFTDVVETPMGCRFTCD